MESVSQEDRSFPPSDAFQSHARISGMSAYRELYERSIADPESFWAEAAEELHWFKKWDRVLNVDEAPFYKWYEGARTNLSYNCLDRQIAAGMGDKTAIHWLGEPGDRRDLTYHELLSEVCRFANVLKQQGIEKGDRVMIYMPMVPELAMACLACARIGAIHSVVFGGFSAEALKSRIQDCGGKMMITADAGLRGKKSVPLKANADAAMEGTSIETCLVLKRTGDPIEMKEGRDVWLLDAMEQASSECPAEALDAEDPLFILYTSGSTGKPKGVLHTSGGYLVYASITHQYVFDYHDGDIYWCTADIGWITGHSYILYGPLSNGATTLMFEGVPNYPDFGRFWDVCDKHKVNIFYTAPTAIRAIAKEGDELVQKRDLSSLKLLGTVGEPINPEAWMWYHDKIGSGRCPIVDTWWQTETGGHMLTPMPGATATKPGCATLPFFGIEPAVLNEAGEEVPAGILAIKKPWPGMMRGIYGDPERYRQTYWCKWEGRYYFPGDGARRDDDGYYWILGRVDDVVNVSGHRIGTAELESVFVEHQSVAESAVVGVPHEIKGQGLIAFVTVIQGCSQDEALYRELVAMIDQSIGKFARPERIIFSSDLPKTRSGKIMRRLLRDIAEGRELGNTTTLADPGVVSELQRQFESGH